MNSKEENLEQYKELEEENNRLREEIKKLEEKSVNELQDLEDHFRKCYKELLD